MEKRFSAGAPALASLLFGKENRWGRLPVTMYPHEYTTQVRKKRQTFFTFTFLGSTMYFTKTGSGQTHKASPPQQKVAFRTAKHVEL